MATPFLGQIGIMAFGFPQRGWARCDGALLPINQNQALFALLGTQYGGNGQTTFALPDLRGRTPVHRSATLPQGVVLGAEAVALTTAQMPPHNHALQAFKEVADSALPQAALLGARAVGGPALLGTIHEAAPVAMSPAAVASAGSSQAHDNMAPFTVLNFVIALQGIFPSRN
jgi:microcystin-dependent protein